MSAEAAAEIRALFCAYTFAGDEGRPAAIAQTFTENGVLEAERGTFRGRKAIEEGVANSMRGSAAKSIAAEVCPAAGPARTDLTMTYKSRHHLTTSLIEFPGSDTATAKTYYIVYSDAGPDHSGTYFDRLVRREGRWLIEHRRSQIDWVSKDSYRNRPGHLR